MCKLWVPEQPNSYEISYGALGESQVPFCLEWQRLCHQVRPLGVPVLGEKVHMDAGATWQNDAAPLASDKATSPANFETTAHSMEGDSDLSHGLKLNKLYMLLFNYLILVICLFDDGYVLQCGQGGWA